MMSNRRSIFFRRSATFSEPPITVGAARVTSLQNTNSYKAAIPLSIVYDASPIVAGDHPGVLTAIFILTADLSSDRSGDRCRTNATDSTSQVLQKIYGFANANRLQQRLTSLPVLSRARVDLTSAISNDYATSQTNGTPPPSSPTHAAFRNSNPTATDPTTKGYRPDSAFGIVSDDTRCGLIAVRGENNPAFTRMDTSVATNVSLPDQASVTMFILSGDYSTASITRGLLQGAIIRRDYQLEASQAVDRLESRPAAPLMTINQVGYTPGTFEIKLTVSNAEDVQGVVTARLDIVSKGGQTPGVITRNVSSPVVPGGVATMVEKISDNLTSDYVVNAVSAIKYGSTNSDISTGKVLLVRNDAGTSASKSTGAEQSPEVGIGIAAYKTINPEQINVEVRGRTLRRTDRRYELVRHELVEGTPKREKLLASFDVGEQITYDYTDNGPFKQNIYYRYSLRHLASQETAPDSSLVLYRNPKLVRTKVGTMSVTNETRDPSSDRFEVSVAFDNQTIEQALAGLSSAVSAQGSDGTKQPNGFTVQVNSFLESLGGNSKNVDQYSDLVRINVVYQDSAANEVDLGNFEIGKIEITDELLAAQGVVGGRDRSSSRYVLRLLQRAAGSLFNDYLQTRVDEATRQEYTVRLFEIQNAFEVYFSAMPSSAASAETDPSSIYRDVVSDPFLLGYTGNNSVIELSSGASKEKSQPKTRMQVRVQPREMTSILMTSDTPGLAATVSLYWNKSKIKDYNAIIDNGENEILDDLGGTLPGERYYTVTVYGTAGRVVASLKSDTIVKEGGSTKPLGVSPLLEQGVLEVDSPVDLGKSLSVDEKSLLQV